MKRKFIAWLISFAMIFSAVVSMPAKVFAEGVDTPSFTDFGLNDTSSVKATWDKNTQTLTVTGNGKIDIDKWVELARKFSENNYKDNDNYGWNINSNFTLNIADKTVQFPDVAVYVKDGETHGFFENFEGEIIINKEIDTSNVTDMSYMFYIATNANPDVSKWDTSNITNMSYMFYGATNANPDVSKWNTSSITNIEGIFGDSGVVKLDLSNWDMSKLTENVNVFKDISKLEFLSFKGLPEKNELTKFAGRYKVDVLNADGSVLKTEGPFEKRYGYEFTENTGYKVYLSNPSNSKTDRIYGDNRYETAVKISQNLISKSDKVFIASGISMIDALNVGPYAGAFQIPVLLTGTNEMEAKTLDEIKRLKAEEVVIIGGVKAVSENVSNQLIAKGLTVTRLYGNDRYETALKIAQKAVDDGALEKDKIFLCSGEKPADALSIASVAAEKGGIILLTDGNTIIKGVEDLIKVATEVKIIGGTAVISSDLENKIKSMVENTERISGNDRYETSVKVYNKYYKSTGVKKIYLANGLTMADALTGAGVAYQDETGILLTSATEMIPSMKTVINEMDKLIILGGNLVVNDNIWK